MRCWEAARERCEAPEISEEGLEKFFLALA